jgi:hypothetical protein
MPSPSLGGIWASQQHKTDAVIASPCRVVIEGVVEYSTSAAE